MNIEIINKLDEITHIIKNDSNFVRINELKKILLNDKKLLDKIKRLNNMSQYDLDYLNLKKEILSNQNFKEYNDLEKEKYLTILLINKELNSLLEKS